MLCIHEGAEAAGFLCLGDNMQRNGGLTGGFRSEDFDDTSARHTADAKGGIQGQNTGGDHLNVLVHGSISKTHDGAGTKLLVDRGNCMFKCLELLFLCRSLADYGFLGLFGLLGCHGLHVPFS